jgi:hypothetical protein
MVLAGVAFAGDWGKESTPSWGKSAAEPVGKRLSVEDPIVVGELALYPVVDREAAGRPELDVSTLGPAMAAGSVRVRETPDGSVDALLLVNRADEPVLAMAGDVVHGGMQDRVLQRSLLVAAGETVRVPVRCVERGRWTGGEGFVYAGRVDPALRSVVRGGDQDATWSAVARRNEARGLPASASWLAGRDLDPRELALAEQALEDRFADDKRVVGVVVARGGTFTGAEVYPHPALFAQDRIEALSGALAAPVVARGSAPSRDDALAFLETSLIDDQD